jgi:hypothetical protein
MRQSRPYIDNTAAESNHDAFSVSSACSKRRQDFFNGFPVFKFFSVRQNNCFRTGYLPADTPHFFGIERPDRSIGYDENRGRLQSLKLFCYLPQDVLTKVNGIGGIF